LPGGDIVRPDDISPVVNPNNLREHFLKKDWPLVWLGEPFVMNQRLVEQSGTFLVPAQIDKPVNDILQEYPNPGDTIAKLVLATEKLRDEAMHRLK
jgi:hypothetical protein